MNGTTQLAAHIRQIFIGPDWAVTNLKGMIEDVTWQEATTRVGSLNTIGMLFYHISYYVDVLLRAVEEGVLQGKDSESYDHPPIDSEEAWQKMRDQLWPKIERFATQIESHPDEWLYEDFIDARYGDNNNNILGFIEHTNYHLGQVALLKKLARMKGD